jgi:hypothetical protein
VLWLRSPQPSFNSYNTGQENKFSRLSLPPDWISPSYHQAIQEEAFALLFVQAL